MRATGSALVALLMPAAPKRRGFRHHVGKASLSMRVWLRTLLLIALMAAAALPAAAQDKKPAAKAQNPQGKPQAAPPATPAAVGPALPDAFKLNLLIRSSIIALNQANQTGNYTVLQDLAAPAFRAANNSARLAQIFGALRQRQLDLSPVLFFTPKLLAQPQIAPNGLLRLTGFFPTQPERVNFDLIYELTDGQWRLFGIGVNTSPAEVTSSLPQGGGEQAAGSSAPPQNAQGQLPAPPANAAPSPPVKAEQKPDAATRPGRKSQASQQIAPAKPGGTPAAAQNAATGNAERIDLGAPNVAVSPAPAQSDAGAEPAPKKPESPWENITPFSGN
jgi:hypothetical protein